MGEREQRLVFGEVAELYDRYRPGYPEAAFDRIMEFSRLRAGQRALEVGSGTGRATVPLARRGLLVTALEPSQEMARVLRRNTAAFPGVAVEEASFEGGWQIAEPFPLLVSAQAWHRVRAETRYVEAYRVLRPGGCLALLWNTADSSKPGNPVLEAAVEDVYRREAPGLASRVPGDIDEDRRTEIGASGGFDQVTREIYSWSTTYSGDEFVGLLQTQSNHRLLDPAVRDRLLTGIAEVVAAHGDEFPQGYRCCLYLARRRH
ncbi:MAG TPA: class I SAM-dependent methyltransferase [Candidatus Dormibacteraeota bacterium]|nr:class I SAM-dependent methyltransferase [Candidatus Dormibacteraeota bacterium]